MRKVEQIMGMPIAIDIKSSCEECLFDAAFDIIKKVDEQFSPYKPTSVLNQIWFHNIHPQNFSDEIKAVYRLCKKYQTATDGYFSANFSGRFDPTGLTKAWAIQKVINYLDPKSDCYMINAGGDIYVRSEGGYIWRAGVNHPKNNNEIIGVIELNNGAITTSGTYARGNHIKNPKTNEPATAIISATITGPDIITADVLATTVCAMGLQKGLDYIEKQKGYEALMIDNQLRYYRTSGFTFAQPKKQNVH